LLIIVLSNCTNKTTINEPSSKIEGTWKLFYAEIYENDSLKIKDLTKTSFIKIINKTHFAFFNQENIGSKKIYGGGGTYTLNGENYVETLSFTSIESIKNHQFPFTVEIKGDTLIQSGVEEVKSAGIKRKIVEKYIKIK